MSYTIKFTDYVGKGSIIVNDGTANEQTSLVFPGRNARGYGVDIAENFLHLLENFANTTPPTNPIEGQLWYDKSNGVEDLKVYDGNTWKSSGSIKKGNSAPTVGNSITGDIWVDTKNQQLNLFNGSSWVLVGPAFSSGLFTGMKPEIVTDSTDVDRVIVKTYVEDVVVSIYSNTEFIPKKDITGFTSIKKGINLKYTILDNNTKFWGISEKAESLLIGNTVIGASQFLRKDTSNITDYGFGIRNDSGITLGAQGQLKIQVINEIGELYHATTNSALDLKINRNGTPISLVRLDATRATVGINNLAPTETLDVDGTGKFTGNVKITSTDNSLNSQTGALVVSGGASINKVLNLGDDLNITGQIYVDYSGSGIIPVNNGITNLGYEDVVTPANNKKFNIVHANTFKGNLEGSIIGDVTGNISGSAAKLTSSTIFKIAGDIASNEVSFDGIPPVNVDPNLNGKVVLTSTISPDFIHNKDQISDNEDVDEFLIYRPGTGVRKILRRDFFADVALVPVGTIMPYAGESTAVPTNYLLCDGSEKPIGTYPDLYAVIKNLYNGAQTLVGAPSTTFRLPDLRGRFPLGKDNMDNGDKVYDKTGSQVDSGGGAANRVMDATGSILGNSAGNEEVALDVTNLPQHTHDLRGDQGTQFYAMRNSSAVSDTNVSSGNGPTSAGMGQYLPTTGNVSSIGNTPADINIMNPYLTINYIIYAGRKI